MSIYFEKKNNNDMKNILKKVDIVIVNKNHTNLRTYTQNSLNTYRTGNWHADLLRLDIPEHEAHRFGHASKSAVDAQNMLSKKHKFGKEKVKLLSMYQIIESLYINNSEDLMNKMLQSKPSYYKVNTSKV